MSAQKKVKKPIAGLIVAAVLYVLYFLYGIVNIPIPLIDYALCISALLTASITLFKTLSRSAKRKSVKILLIWCVSSASFLILFTNTPFTFRQLYFDYPYTYSLPLHLLTCLIMNLPVGIAALVSSIVVAARKNSHYEAERQREQTLAEEELRAEKAKREQEERENLVREKERLAYEKEKLAYEIELEALRLEREQLAKMRGSLKSTECQFCGMTNDAGAKFCGGCGATFGKRGD